MRLPSLVHEPQLRGRNQPRRHPILQKDAELDVSPKITLLIGRNERLSLRRAFRSEVTIFFKDDDFIFSKRSELYSFTDFIANFGGILGLFLGVSILSIVEIIYFMAFREISDDPDSEKSVEASPVKSPLSSISNDTTVADEVIKADDDEVSVRSGY